MQSAKIRSGAVLGAMLAMLCFAASSTAKQSSHYNPGNGVYWGAWIGDQLTGTEPPWDMSAVSKFEQMLGKGLSLVEFSGPFSQCGDSGCTPLAFPSAEMDTIRGYGAIPVFSWASDSTPVPEIPEEHDYRLRDIADGAYDPYVREFAEGAKAWGHPFFLRFNWEMNGNWFPWSERVNGNAPGDYVAAWRHVHDIFAEVGATNASWVWCPYVGARQRSGSLRHYYPGDRYVDWTCLDGYNWGHNYLNPSPWRSFDELFGPSYRQIVQKIAPHKPLMLGEMATNGSGRAKAKWIRQMFKALPAKYPKARGLIWFDQPDRGMHWTLESSPSNLKAFSSGISRPMFKGSHYAALSTSPIPPPR